MSATMAAIAAGSAARSEAKAYLRVETGDEDALIDRLAASAVDHGEGFTGQTLLRRQAVEMLPVSAVWRRLSRTPVASIGAVEGVPVDGAVFALAADAYAIDIDANGDGWVRVTRPGIAGRVRVTYQAGLAADWSGLPEAVRQGLVRLIAHLFTCRDADGEQPPAAVAALLRPWRRMRLS